MRVHVTAVDGGSNVFHLTILQCWNGRYVE
jgi:hypothetical protein